MVAVTEFSWEDISAPDFGNAARAAWREAVAQVADKAKATLPECTGRVDRAVTLVLAGDVELLADGTARVGSQSDGRTQYVVCNGTCPCKDFAAAPHAFCKHRLGAAIARRAQSLLQAQERGLVVPEPVQAAPAAGLPPQHVVMIQGKPFVRFAGLLQMGLRSQGDNLCNM